jgi:hypothetical protein
MFFERTQWKSDPFPSLIDKPIRAATPFPLPGGEGQGEGERPTNFPQKSLFRTPTLLGNTPVATIWLAILILAQSASAAEYILRWTTNSANPVVEVNGLSSQTLQQFRSSNWSTEDFQKLLPVYVDQGSFLADMSVPPMLGRYAVEEKVLRFQPQFALERGVTYRAVLRLNKLPAPRGALSADLVSKFQMPAAQGKPTTIVTQIYPTADVLPENLLKFYVHFSAPMQGGHIYNHIQLLNESGKAVELPFLEIDEELWNPEMTRLTLFIDPGRIKRGVQPLEEIGPALETGKRYALHIDAEWRDAAGQPLRESYRKSFTVGPQDREPPTLAAWKIASPRAKSREPLTVTFPEPMDHALALRVIRVADVAGHFVEGSPTLTDREKRWTFTPQKDWGTGKHELQVQNTIEDLAGNNIGKTFEVDLFEGVQRRFTNQVVRLSFEVR